MELRRDMTINMLMQPRINTNKTINLKNVYTASMNEAKLGRSYSGATIKESKDKKTHTKIQNEQLTTIEQRRYLALQKAGIAVPNITQVNNTTIEIETIDLETINTYMTHIIFNDPSNPNERIGEIFKTLGEKAAQINLIDSRTVTEEEKKFLSKELRMKPYAKQFGLTLEECEENIDFLQLVAALPGITQQEAKHYRHISDNIQKTKQKDAFGMWSSDRKIDHVFYDSTRNKLVHLDFNYGESTTLQDIIFRFADECFPYYNSEFGTMKDQAAFTHESQKANFAGLYLRGLSLMLQDDSSYAQEMGEQTVALVNGLTRGAFDSTRFFEEADDCRISRNLRSARNALALRADPKTFSDIYFSEKLFTHHFKLAQKLSLKRIYTTGNEEYKQVMQCNEEYLLKPFNQIRSQSMSELGAAWMVKKFVERALKQETSTNTQTDSQQKAATFSELYTNALHLKRA